jgi:hypothetical protein
MNLNAIKARLGSLSKQQLSGLSPSVQKLLKDDMPALLKALECKHMRRVTAIGTVSGDKKPENQTCIDCGLIGVNP